MKQELEEKILKSCPTIFPDAQDFWGFECGDGWFDIINELCCLIEHELKYNKELSVKVVQVKEKFGGLRFYINGGNEKIYGMISLAEQLSTITCEVCGSKGKLREDRAWLRTLCDEHNL